MGIIYAEKAIHDVCIYIPFAAYLFRLFGMSSSPWQSFAVTAAVLILLILLRKKTNKVVRLLPLALLGVCFIGVRNVYDILFPIPLCFYACYMAFSGAWMPDRDDIERLLSPLMVLFAVVTVVSLVTRTSAVLSSAAIPFFVLLLATSVVLLNTLRHSDAAGLGIRFQLINLAIIAAVAAVGFILSSRAFVSLCVAAATFLWQKLVSPLLMLLAMIFVGIGWAVVKLLSFILPGRAEQESQDIMQIAVGGAQQMYQQIEGSDSKIFQKIMMAMGIALFIGLTVIIMRRIAKRGSAAASEEVGVTSREAIGRAEGGAVRNPFRKNSPRGQVRTYFRRFMELCADMGRLNWSDTSEDVCSVYRSSISAPDPEELRSVWLRARYSTHEVSEDDVKAAKNAYNALKAAQKENLARLKKK